MKPEGYDRTKLSLALQLCEAVEEQNLQCELFFFVYRLLYISYLHNHLQKNLTFSIPCVFFFFREVWKLLHCAGADPNILIPEKGISPFHLVIGCDCNSFAEEVTRVFLQYNGNPNVRLVTTYLTDSQ